MRLLLNFGMQFFASKKESRYLRWFGLFRELTSFDTRSVNRKDFGVVTEQLAEILDFDSNLVSA